MFSTQIKQSHLETTLHLKLLVFSLCQDSNDFWNEESYSSWISTRGLQAAILFLVHGPYQQWVHPWLLHSTQVSGSFSTHSMHQLKTDQSSHMCHLGPETWAHRDRVPSQPLPFYKYPVYVCNAELIQWQASLSILKQSEHVLRWVGLAWHLPHSLHVSAVTPQSLHISPLFHLFLLDFVALAFSTQGGKSTNLPIISTNKMEVVLTH